MHVSIVLWVMTLSDNRIFKMRSASMPINTPDLSGLMELARNRDIDVRPVILRVQTDLFIAATSHDHQSIRQYESLACGLIPLVDDTTAIIVAEKIGRCAFAPPSVLNALRALGGDIARALDYTPVKVRPDNEPDTFEDVSRFERTVAQLLNLQEDAVDLALAAHDPLIRHVGALQLLLEAAQRRPVLAKALLARPDLSLPEQAYLYLQGSQHQKAFLHEQLASSAVVPGSSAIPRAGEESIIRLAMLADARDGEGFEQEIMRLLKRNTPLNFTQEGREDLLALSLAALDIPPDMAIGMFLTLDARIGQSTQVVFRLAETIRTIPRLVACYLVSVLTGESSKTSEARHKPVMYPSTTPVRSISQHAPARADVFIPERFKAQL
jgi:hypothetical protein